MKKRLLLPCILLFMLLLPSCSSKFAKSYPLQEEYSVEAGYKTATVLDTREDMITEEVLTPFQADQDALVLNSQPYFDPNSPLYAGLDHTDFLQSFLFPTDNQQDPVPVADFEHALKHILIFTDAEESSIKTYISDFSQEGTIERQFAMAGFMKLLSLKYPITLGGDNESIKKSDAVLDMTAIDDPYGFLVRQAHCLGFTDYTVSASLVFRPTDRLTHLEAVSMISRVLARFGPPAIKPATEISASAEATPAPVLDASDDFNSEKLQQEIKTYRESLLQSKSKNAAKKVELLALAQETLDASDEQFMSDAINEPILIEQWVKVFNQCFEIEIKQIEPYVLYETGGILTYDIAAISIFKLSYLFGGYDVRDATPEEIEEARLSIPQFDTARDISKMAQMHASGLLDGILTLPGFTPQRPVSRAEAMLLVNRMVKAIK